MQRCGTVNRTEIGDLLSRWRQGRIFNAAMVDRHERFLPRHCVGRQESSACWAVLGNPIPISHLFRPSQKTRPWQGLAGDRTSFPLAIWNKLKCGVRRSLRVPRGRTCTVISKSEVADRLLSDRPTFPALGSTLAGHHRRQIFCRHRMRWRQLRPYD
jgi:hypothetical protein